MKKLFTTTFLLILYPFCYSQTNNDSAQINQNKPLEIEKVILLPGQSKDLIYLKAFNWAKSYLFNSSDISDRQLGLISSEMEHWPLDYSIMKENGKSKKGIIYNYIDYKWKIECKDGKCRIRYFDISVGDRNSATIDLNSQVYTGKFLVYSNEMPSANKKYALADKTAEWAEAEKAIIKHFNLLIYLFESSVTEKKSDFDF